MSDKLYDVKRQSITSSISDLEAKVDELLRIERKLDRLCYSFAGHEPPAAPDKYEVHSSATIDKLTEVTQLLSNSMNHIEEKLNLVIDAISPELFETTKASPLPAPMSTYSMERGYRG